jgi:hypothetical protein
LPTIRVGAAALERAHRMAHVERVAETGVGVDDQRQRDGVAHAGSVFRDFVQTDEAEVG